MTKSNLKNIAREMRIYGASYSEILKKVPVSKSTLSGWVKNITLSKELKLKLEYKKIQGVNLGGLKRKEERIRKTNEIIKLARANISTISKENLFFIGLALYWGEGAKQKETNVSQSVCFSSSNAQILKIFLLWLDRICQVTESRLIFDLYIHESANIERSLSFWESTLKIPKNLLRIRYKKNLIKTNRKNIGNSYYGQIRITVRKSTDLNRKINGWIVGTVEQCGIV